MYRNGAMSTPIYALINEWYDFMLRLSPVKIDQIGKFFKFFCDSSCNRKMSIFYVTEK